MKTAQELASMLETGSGLVRSQLLEAAAMLIQQAEQIEALTKERDGAYVQSLQFSEENKALLKANLDCVDNFNTLKADYDALKADAERLDLIESVFFGKRWNGVIDSGSRTTWCIVPGYRHSTCLMVGHTFRAAIDAMKGKS